MAVMLKQKLKCKLWKKVEQHIERVVERENGKKSIFNAKCASNTTPFDLDINIKLANYKSYDDLVKELINKLTNYKSGYYKTKARFIV